jgi:peptide/nickel transport system permease protein
MLLWPGLIRGFVMTNESSRKKVQTSYSLVNGGFQAPISVLSERQRIWRRFKRTRFGVTGGVVVLLLYTSALLAGFLAPYDCNRQFIHRVHTPPQRIHLWDHEGLHWPFVYDYRMTFSEDGLERIYQYDESRRFPIHLFTKGDSYRFLGLFETSLHLFGADGTSYFVLGTDRMGRDLLSRILYGGCVSLTIGLLGVAITLALGTIIGTISGYYSGWIDLLIQRLIELLLVFPTIPLWMALAAALPPHWSQLNVYFGIVTILSFVGWGGLARQVRGMVLSLRERAYVKTACSFGGGDAYIIFKHLIPGCYSHLIVIATLSVPGMILGETALSFLGLGIRPPMTSWGVLLEEAQHVRVIVSFPWLLAPALPVLVTVIAFNFLGDALRDAIEP